MTSSESADGQRPVLLILGRGLFARDVDRAVACTRQHAGGLGEQRGFADARIATDQYQRSRYDAATQHSIEFGKSRIPPFFFAIDNLGKGQSRNGMGLFVAIRSRARGFTRQSPRSRDRRFFQ